MTMHQLSLYAKLAWVYTTSMFLPTALITPRIERALDELAAGQRPG